MLDRFKEEALNIVGRFADSGKGIDLLANPALQAALTRALTLQTELRDHWERQVEGMAKSLNLVSKRDVLKVKRQVRDLENLVATLEHQLKQQTLRTKRAEKDLASARADAKKTVKPVKTAAKKAPAKKTVAKKAPAKKAAGKKAPSKQS